jgi:beta-glucosidase
MKRLIKFMMLACTLTLVACSNQAPYQNKSLSPTERAADLVSRLTLEEKITLMQNNSSAVKRLGIKPYEWWNEALHGVARNGLATVYPQAIGMGASFNDTLLYQVFTSISDEARVKYRQAREAGNYKRYTGLTFWTPNINIFRDPRWGRGQETYGEDPYLTSRMGLSVVNGLQGPQNTKYNKTHACAKHYAVHSGPEWNRHSFNAENINPRDLWETYLPAFQDLVIQGNVKEVMCAYNRFEGDPCCGSDRLLINILRNEWNYKGLVVSDCGAIDNFYFKGRHETHKNKADASAAAVLSGTDLECGRSYTGLISAVKEGLINESAIDQSLCRLMKARFELGEMDDTTPWDQLPDSLLSCHAHQQLALQMARESMTLLQNHKNILPLDKEMTVALIGPNANDSVMQWANYNGFPVHTITLLEGLTQYLPQERLIYIPQKNIEVQKYPWVNYYPNDIQAVINQAAKADVIIYAGGISASLEGEEMDVDAEGFRGGDRTTIELPNVQRKLVKALKATGKPIVFVNFSGCAMGLQPESQICDAILQAWYPGQAGGTAIAEVLFGDYNPAGRLPITFYKKDNQLPDFEDYNMQGRTYRYLNYEPLYPFGHELSYTTFSYSTPFIENGKLKVKVTNSGNYNGDEVIQLYIKRYDDPDGPLKTLRGFQRIHIPAGQTSEVSFPLTSDTFTWWDKDSNTVHPLQGRYKILVGGTSEESLLKSIEYKYSPTKKI